MRSYFLTTALFFALAATSNAQQETAPVAVTEATPETAVAHASAKPSQAHEPVTVNRLVLATAVVQHEPQNIKENFSTHDGKVYAFVELTSKEESHITFQWKRDGKAYWEYKAKVGNSPRWRTFSAVTAHPGHWTVALLDAQGNVLKEAAFQVDNAGGAEPAAVSTNKNVEKAEKLESADPKPASGVREVLQSLEPAKDPEATEPKEEKGEANAK